jgi:hypothetical protein
MDIPIDILLPVRPVSIYSYLKSQKSSSSRLRRGDPLSDRDRTESSCLVCIWYNGGAESDSGYRWNDFLMSLQAIIVL